MERKKLAIIGASYLQNPLILKAKNRGIETHVFAWKCGDIGEKTADRFYPISIVEKDEILNKCKEIGIDGICSIASDLANITVNYVADKLKLNGNSLKCTEYSTNKSLMKKALLNNGLPTSRGITINDISEADNLNLDYPLIVKPTDRSGSRGITLLNNKDGLKEAVERSISYSFEHKAIIEEFADGNEYSVECISCNGKHTLLSVTKKYTTGSPHFVETGHLEPSDLDEKTENKVKEIIFKALDALEIKNGASHSEFKINEHGVIKIIEIGSRMGGDNIGSHLVELSTGFDFVNSVIDVALGIDSTVSLNEIKRFAAIKYIMDKKDIDMYVKLKEEHPEMIVEADINDPNDNVTQSADRSGYYIICSDKKELVTAVFQ